MKCSASSSKDQFCYVPTNDATGCTYYNAGKCKLDNEPGYTGKGSIDKGYTKEATP